MFKYFLKNTVKLAIGMYLVILFFSLLRIVFLAFFGMQDSLVFIFP